MFRLTIIACLLCLGAVANAHWFDNAVVYQVYPRSFKDSNGDGIGDLNGITSKLEHIADVGAQVVWLSPIYKSPQVDFGYDISNFTDVDPGYGTLADFDKLIAKAKSLGLKVILDFVPNHSSDKHPWFQQSIQKIKPYDEYYVWRDGKVVNGTRYPPNNWLSNFGGSAWQWNDVRKQYYLHQFAAGQPDLNYRSPALDQEMKDALSFWLKRGISGFRIDVINHLFEDKDLRDEPSSNRPGVPKDDYDSLVHIYTANLHESYEVMKSWRQLLDDYSEKTNTDKKLVLTETYAAQNYTIKYYSYGSIPFNFMFVASLNNQSTAVDFAKTINSWIDAIPSGHVADWVVDNHDNHRVAARFGTKRADQITMLSMMLPGITVVYYGDEIGMEDRYFTYQETVDTAGCNAGPERYYLKSRDPARTPFQWDNTTNAGFSTGSKTWLPVNSNYKTLNLAAQKVAEISHYKVFKAMVALKNSGVLTKGSAEVTVVKDKVLAVVRQLGRKYALLLTNFSDLPVTVNTKTALDLPSEPILQVYTASIGSDVAPGSLVYGDAVTVPGSASVVVIAS